ncbi:sugar transferase [Parasphingorhabdus sp.]|uniref:sugar transferase n=1 Tax=Parasphingorhabdus sp. TaxID=2709688 RepID=UPI0032678C81
MTIRIKRILDLTLAIAMALPAALTIAVCALVVLIEARTNPLFFQTRVGLGTEHFRLVKLRTMTAQTKNLPSHEVGTQTMLKSGRIFRAIKLDELPQIWNVLTGEMSFVGPRPCLPVQADLIEERSKRGVYEIRPGITGLAQIAGIDMSTPRKLAEIDARYLNQQSFSGDLIILARTLLGGGSGDAIV